MGVRIEMRPGTVLRSAGETVDITPGFRSKAVTALTEKYGNAPFELTVDDAYDLQLMALGESVQLLDSQIGMFQLIVDAIAEHGVVTVDWSY